MKKLHLYTADMVHTMAGIKLHLLILMFFLIHPLVYPQVEVPVSSAEKFNKRGIYENGDFRVKGKEILSDYDGNLMLEYNTPIILPNDLGGDFTVRYNSNVSHRFFNKPPDNHAGGFPVNAAEWILGYKGIALQALNFDTYFYMLRNPNPSIIGGTDVPLIIPGYHYSNRLAFGPGTSLDHDNITILRSDGTTVTLQSVESKGENTDDQGIYLEQGIDNKGFAITQIYSPDTTYAPAAKFRKVYYKPGDGLTYYFEEEPIIFKDRNGDKDQYKFYDPKVMYLKKIFNNAGDYVEFIYENTAGSQTVEWGRKVFTGIKTNLRESNINGYELFVDYNFGVGDEKIIINNYNSDDALTLGIANPFNDLFGITGEDNKERVYYISYISDKVNRTDSIYYSHLQDLTKRSFRYDVPLVSISDGSNTYWYDIDFWVKYDFYLIDKIRYNNGKVSDFTYWDRYFFDTGGLQPGIELATEAAGDLNYMMEANLQLTYRDCYTNFMLSGRTISDANLSNPDSIISYEEFTYVKGGNSQIFSSKADSIITKIKKWGAGNSSPSTLNIKKYSKINTLERVEIYAAWDAVSTIKLMVDSVQVFNQDFPNLTKKYSYDIGSYVEGVRPEWSYYDGDFRILSEVEDRNVNSANKISLTTNYQNYVFDVVTFKDTNFTKKLIKEFIKSDPQSLYRLSKFKNFTNLNYPVSFTDTNYYYRIGLPEEEKTYNSTLVKQHYKNIFFDSEYNGELKGRLKQKQFNPDNNIVTNDYSYYLTQENSFYHGLLKSEISNSGLVKQYYYPANTSSPDANIYESVSGQTVKYDGTKANYTATHYGYQLNPFKTVLTDNGSINYEFYVSYDKMNNKVFEKDINGYFTKYGYDNIGRLTDVFLPGSFTNLNFDANYSSKIIYNDTQNTIEQKTRFSNDPVNTTEYKTKLFYDPLGHIKNEYVYGELKNSKAYDFMGLVSEETNGTGIKKVYTYDYLSRLTNTTFLDNSDQQFNYTWENNTVSDISYIEKTEFTDEEGKKTFSYFDRAGNKIAERKGSETANPTLFYYDSIYRLIKVVSPDNITTDYDYDQNGNVIYKHSPDYGTYKYKYDKFNRLRYQYHTGSDELIFNNYDAFNRLLSTGTINGCSDSLYNALDAETLNTGIDYNESNYVLVNIYDEYNSSGVFAALEYPQGFVQENLKGRLAAEAYRDKPGVAWSFKLYSYDPLGRIKEQRIVE